MLLTKDEIGKLVSDKIVGDREELDLPNNFLIRGDHEQHPLFFFPEPVLAEVASELGFGKQIQGKEGPAIVEVVELRKEHFEIPLFHRAELYQIASKHVCPNLVDVGRALRAWRAQHSYVSARVVRALATGRR